MWQRTRKTPEYSQKTPVPPFRDSTFLSCSQCGIRGTKDPVLACEELNVHKGHAQINILSNTEERQKTDNKDGEEEGKSQALELGAVSHRS